MLYKVLPNSLYNILKSLQLKFRILLANKNEFRLVVGSGGVYPVGWIPTGLETIDVGNDKTWHRFFKPKSLDAIMGEHIWEHLSPEEAISATNSCFEYLKPGGYCRIAVPDGLHPDPVYLKGVGPIGPNELHKVMYDYKSIKVLFESAGFTVSLLEYYDNEGVFHNTDWDANKGLIHRSIRFRNKHKDVSCLGLDNYTSLIIDAYKPNE